MTLTASVDDVADNLLRFHEDATSAWVERCTDEEFGWVCNAAEFLLYYGPKRASGSTRLIDKALAIAAVYVAEGTPRKLARSTRDNTRVMPSRPPLHELDKRRTNVKLMEARGYYDDVHDEFVAFWPNRQMRLERR